MRNRLFSVFVSLMLLGGVARADEASYAGVSEDAELVFVADLQSLSASPLIMMIEQMMQMQSGEAPEDPKALAMGITEHTGLTRDHLGKFVFSAVNINQISEFEEQPSAAQINDSGLLMSFQFTQAISPEQFDAWVQSQVAKDETITETVKSNVGDAILYTDKSEESGAAIGLLPTEGGSVVFIGAEKSVTAALNAKSGALPKNIATAQSLIPSMPNLVILASPTAAMKEQLLADATDPANAAYIQDTDQLAFGLNVSDGLKLLTGVKFGSAETASKAYADLSSFIAEMKAQPADGPMMMLASVIQNLKATDNGQAVGLSTELSPMECQQLLMMLPMMFMQMQMQQQQQGGGMQMQEETITIESDDGM